MSNTSIDSTGISKLVQLIHNTFGGVKQVRYLSESEYEALAVKDPNVEYRVLEDE